MHMTNFFMFIENLNQYYNFKLLWILIVLFSFYELGRIFSFFFYPVINKSVGERLTLGILINLFFGGLLIYFNIPNKEFLIIFSSLLFIYLCLRKFFFFLNKIKIFYHRPYNILPSKSKISLPYLIINIFHIFFLLSIIAISTHSVLYNNLDDFTGYFPLVEQILAKGNLSQEFSFRKILILGGHQYLQAFFSSALTDNEYFCFELGISVIVIYFIIINFIKQNIKEKSAYYLFYVLLVFGIIFIKVPTLNTSSIISSVSLLIFLLLKIEKFQDFKNFKYKYIALLSLIISGLLTLRTNNLVFSFYLIFFMILLQNRTNKIFNNVKSSFQIVTLTFISILPWLIIQYKINKSVFFPLFPGNASYEAKNYFSKKIISTDIIDIQFKTIYDLFFVDYYLSSFNIFLILLFIIYYLSKQRKIILLLLTYILSFVTIFFGTINYQELTSRYIFPLTISLYIYCFFLIYKFFFRFDKIKFFLFIFIILLPLFLKTNFKKTIIIMKEEILMNAKFIIYNEKVRLLFNDEKKVFNYKYLQELTKKNSKILVADDTPILFNFRRNKILVVDYPGYVSINNDMPKIIDTNSFIKYLIDNEINYIIKIIDDYAYPEFFNTKILEEKKINMSKNNINYKIYHSYYLFNSNIKKLLEDPSFIKIYSGHLVLIEIN